MNEAHADVVILGGGLVGMTLAIGLAKAGISSHVVDNSDPAAQTAEGFDGRASAISTASWNLYQHLGMADALARALTRALQCELLYQERARHHVACVAATPEGAGHGN